MGGIPGAVISDGATIPNGVLLDELLHDVCTDGPPPIEVVVSILIQLCDALAFSHERGRAHGDVRPGRLLLARTGRVHLLGVGSEHGIARQHSYAAFELEDGAAAAAPADVFSVGVIAYELLTGRPLFGDNLDRELRACIATRITPPSVFNRDCPAPLSALVLRALALDPSERWASARDMHDALCMLGRPADDAVEHWLAGTTDPGALGVLAFTPPPSEVPPPPPRLPRGSSSRLPTPEEVVRRLAARSVHDAATEIRPSTVKPVIALPIEPARDLTEVLDSLEPDASLPLATPGEMIAPTEPDAPLEQPPHSRPRYLALGLSFVAGAATLYLLSQLLGW